jgi:hypothetical protein
VLELDGKVLLTNLVKDYELLVYKIERTRAMNRELRGEERECAAYY